MFKKKQFKILAAQVFAKPFFAGFMLNRIGQVYYTLITRVYTVAGNC
jgi:hypothetical protein